MNTQVIFNEAALQAFTSYVNDPVVWRGRSVQKWVASIVSDPSLLDELPTGTVSLTEVRRFCSNTQHSDEACFWVVVAWGGMRSTHARRAWEFRALWKPILSDLRSGGLTQRSIIYDRFLEANIPGLATAYFTKLMYFMSTGDCCFILDQWTARSANMLQGIPTPLIHLFYSSSSAWVSRKNRGDTYEAYCALVEALAKNLGKEPEQVEQSMFAGGGKHRWRRYVVDNRFTYKSRLLSSEDMS